MEPNSLGDSIHQQIEDLCSLGDSQVEQGNLKIALKSYHDALHLLPEPVEDWEAATWIYTAIGDLYFQARQFSDAIEALKAAVRCPGGLGNPFIHLRLGESHYELGHEDLAADELTRAYMGAGRDIFAAEDPKYIDFLATRIKPPTGQEHL